MGIRLDDPLIEDRARNAAHRGFARIECAAAAPDTRAVAAAGENPFCGDELEVRLVLHPTVAGTWRIEDAAFDGYGCTLCLAAADAAMEFVCGREASEALSLDFDGLCALLGGLEVGRTRRGCAELPLRIMRQALEALKKEEALPVSPTPRVLAASQVSATPATPCLSEEREKARGHREEPVDRRSRALA